jgi:hypothetical protein
MQVLMELDAALRFVPTIGRSSIYKCAKINKVVLLYKVDICLRGTQHPRRPISPGS